MKLIILMTVLSLSMGAFAKGQDSGKKGGNEVPRPKSDSGKKGGG